MKIISTHSNNPDLFAERFEILATHTGGMGTVFICKDVHNGRLIAAKTPHYAHERFSRECRFWLGLGSHSHIVRAHLVHYVDLRPFLFMDFIGDNAGNIQNLRSFINEGYCSSEFIAKVGISIIRALQHAQTIFPGFVHRDLKPENILIDDKKNMLISDFGIGHIPKITTEISSNTIPNYSSQSSLCTEVGSFIGTIGYASPEQYFDSSSVTFQSDLYSLGLILYELLTGFTPYPPHVMSRHGISIMKVPLSSPPNIKDDFSKSLWDITIDLLQFNPKSRPKSLKIVEEELLKLCPDIGPLEPVNRTSNNCKTVMQNRIYSLLALQKDHLAISALITYQKKFPFSPKTSLIFRKIISDCPTDDRWRYTKKILLSSLESPENIVFFILFFPILLSPIIIALLLSFITISEFCLISFLYLIIYGENRINTLTGITLDKFTLPGMGLGLFLTLILRFFNYETISETILTSIYGAFIALGILVFLEKIYNHKTGRSGIGGGTIKLMIMIGCWIGLLILPVIAMAILILFVQHLLTFIVLVSVKENIEIGWRDNILCRCAVFTDFEALPTSTAIFLSTWIVLTVHSVYPLL